MDYLTPLLPYLDIHPLDWTTIGTAILCGIIVGFERQIRGKPVGMRTSSLIVLGTYIFVTTSLLVGNEVSDSSRIIGQVATGIGFLGAGVMLTKGGTVLGVTSAATIWALAAIGVVVATVGGLIAIRLSILVVVILYGIDLIESVSSALTQGAHSKYRNWREKDE